MTRFVLVLVVITQLAGAKTPELRDSLRFNIPSNPRLSPDGNWVTYQLSRTNWEDNAFEGDLYVARAISSEEPRPIAVGPGWNGDVRWSPDSKQIAFISDRTGRRQIFVTTPAGGEPRKVTSVECGVNDFKWAPDGQSFAFTADDDSPRGSSDFEVVNSSRTSRHLWRVGAAPGSRPAEIARDKAYSVSNFAWSPDGSKIAFQSEGIFTLDIASGAIATIAGGNGPYRNPVWSPSGDSIAFETAGGASGFYYANWFLARASAQGGGETEPLTKEFDENADLVSWTPAGIYFGALQKTESHLFLLNPASKEIRRITNNAHSVTSLFSVTADGARFAYLDGRVSALPEIMVGLDHQVTHINDQLKGFDLARREVVRWKSEDGTEIEGILFKPADFDPAKKYPLLVVIHGGPVAVDQAMVRPDRTYPLEQFVAKGALVLRPNYRGSAGYGAKLRGLAVRNLGTGDAADILSGVDSLVARGFVDPARVGAMGWSEGGYVSAFLATYCDRFRAVSVGAGVSDWLTYYVNTDITPFTRQYLKATPWDDPEIYRKSSPITYVNRAQTPVLIQHGDMDRRVPIPNAYELRQALEDHKVPVKMIVYKGFGHAIDRPRQQRAAMKHNLEWFTEWILDPKAPSKDAAPVSLSQAIADSTVDGLQ